MMGHNMKTRTLTTVLALMILTFSFKGFAASDPWTSAQLVQPEGLAQTLKSSPDGKAPFLVHVGFQVLFKNGHIPGSHYAGPTNGPAGLESLQKAVEKLPRDYPVVIYCGCCPLKKCPNVRPAFQKLQAMGFTNIQVLNLPDDFKKNWLGKGLPEEK